MARNMYAGTCYRCGANVTTGAGHFEKYGRSWRTQHADCAIRWRGKLVTSVADALKQHEEWERGQTAKEQ